MKKMILMSAVIGFVLAIGSTYGWAGYTMVNREDDSIINRLDPSTVWGYVDPESRAVAKAFEAVIESGSAAGGAGTETDTIMNALDPSEVAGYVDPESRAVTKAPEEVIARGSAAGGVNMDHDTILNTLDPSRVPGYMDPESGAVTREGAL